MSVNPFFGTVVNYYLLYFFIILLFIGISRKINLFNIRVSLVILSAYVLILIQYFTFGGFSLAGLYLPIITFYVPYLLYRIVGLKLVHAFIKIMFVIVLFTTPLWFLQSFVPAIDSFFLSAIQVAFEFSFASTPRSLLLFTPMWSSIGYYEPFGFYRNSGLFHEPGAYGIFLLLAIILNTIVSEKFTNKKNLAFLFAAFTTISTTAFITLFIFIAFVIAKSKVDFPFKVVFTGLFLAFAIYTYNDQAFLREKIVDQYEYQTYAAEFNLGVYAAHSGRFYGFFVSLDNFLHNPVFGRGILYATSEKATGEMHKEASYSYGFMGFLATYGLFYGLFFLTFFYFGFRYISQINHKSPLFAIIGYITINLSLLTQVFITTAPIVYFFIVGLIEYRNRSK